MPLRFEDCPHPTQNRTSRSGVCGLLLAPSEMPPNVRYCAGFWTPAIPRRSARSTGQRPKKRQGTKSREVWHRLRCRRTLRELIVLNLANPLPLSSQPATGLSALASAQRAGAQRLCALALRAPPHYLGRKRGITEIDRPERSPCPSGCALQTLRHAGHYVAWLQKAKQNQHEWLLPARGRSPALSARPDKGRA